MHAGFRWGYLRERVHLVDLGIYVENIETRSTGSWMGRHWPDCCGSG